MADNLLYPRHRDYQILYLNPDYTLLPRRDTLLSGSGSTVRMILGFQPDDKLIYCRGGGEVGRNSDSLLYRNNADGTPDPSLTSAQLIGHDSLLYEHINSYMIQPNGKFILIYNNRIMRLQQDGRIDSSLAKSVHYQISLAYQYIKIIPFGQNKALVFGMFDRFDNRPTKSLVRIFLDDTASVLGVRPSQFRARLQLNPNPGTNSIILTSTHTGLIVFYNAQGKAALVQSKHNPEAITISVADLPPGLYTVRLGMEQVRLVKE